jgi:hypothetical protein
MNALSRVYLRSRIDIRFLFNSCHRSFVRAMEAHHETYKLQEKRELAYQKLSN